MIFIFNVFNAKISGLRVTNKIKKVCVCLTTTVNLLIFHLNPLLTVVKSSKERIIYRVL